LEFDGRVERFRNIRPTTIRKMRARPPSTPPTIAPVLFDEELELLELEVLGVDGAVLVLVAEDEKMAEDEEVGEVEEVSDPEPPVDEELDDDDVVAAPSTKVVFGVAKKNSFEVLSEQAKYVLSCC
jgi:hypothetical protein